MNVCSVFHHYKIMRISYFIIFYYRDNKDLFLHICSLMQHVKVTIIIIFVYDVKCSQCCLASNTDNTRPRVLTYGRPAA